MKFLIWCRWSVIASKLHGRTDNDVKNYWNTKLKKKIMTGKINLKSLSRNDNTIPSITPIPQNFNTKNSQYSLPSPLPPMLENNFDASYEFNNEINIGFDQIVEKNIVASEIGTSNNNNNNVVNPMAAICEDSSNDAMNNNCVSIQDQAANESIDPLLDFDFGFHYDHDRVDDFALNCGFSDWVDFSYPEIKPN